MNLKDIQKELPEGFSAEERTPGIFTFTITGLDGGIDWEPELSISNEGLRAHIQYFTTILASMVPVSQKMNEDLT